MLPPDVGGAFVARIGGGAVSSAPFSVFGAIARTGSGSSCHKRAAYFDLTFFFAADECYVNNANVAEATVTPAACCREPDIFTLLSYLRLERSVMINQPGVAPST